MLASQLAAIFVPIISSTAFISDSASSVLIFRLFRHTATCIFPQLTCCSRRLFRSCLVSTIVYTPLPISLIFTPPVHPRRNRIIDLWLIFLTN